MWLNAYPIFSHLQQQKQQTRIAMMMIPASTDTVMINIWKLTVNQTWTQGQSEKTPNTSLHEQILSLSKHSNELLSGKDANVFYSEDDYDLWRRPAPQKRGKKSTLISFSFFADMVHYKLFFLLVNLAIWAFFHLFVQSLKCHKCILQTTYSCSNIFKLDSKSKLVYSFYRPARKWESHHNWEAFLDNVKNIFPPCKHRALNNNSNKCVCQSYASIAPNVHHSVDKRCWRAGCSSPGIRCIFWSLCTTGTATNTVINSYILSYNFPFLWQTCTGYVFGWTAGNLLSHSASIHHKWCWISRHRELKQR